MKATLLKRNKPANRYKSTFSSEVPNKNIFHQAMYAEEKLIHNFKGGLDVSMAIFMETCHSMP